MTPCADDNMCHHAKQRGRVWVQIGDREVIATLLLWRDRRARVEFASGKQRTIDTSRVRPLTRTQQVESGHTKALPAWREPDGQHSRDRTSRYA